ncbi:MAG TPA: T9SS type A sorting domain-containing protein [Bacteroidia bacterium]|nr:T9SS type A sorting domain-containing protein [Bacteroidia bacterium]
MQIKALLLYFCLTSGFTANSQASFTIGPSVCINGPVTLAASAGTLSGVAYSWSVAPPSASFSALTGANTTITFTQIGNYTVSLSLTSGTVNSLAQHSTNAITGFPIAINISMSSFTTCLMMNSPKLSKPVTLTASGADYFNWFPYSPPSVPCSTCSSIQVRPQSTTCYSVYGYSYAGCTGSAVVCVSVIPQFTFGVAPPAATICEGDAVFFTCGNIGPGAAGNPSAFTYSWTESPNAAFSLSSYLTPTTLATPLNSTTYTVEVTDTQSCVSQAQTVTVNVQTCVGLVDQEEGFYDFRLFPNPSTGQFTLDLKGTDFTEIQVINSNGQLVWQGLCNGEQDNYKEPDLSALETGLYLLILKGPNRKQVIRLVKLI